MFRPYSSIFLKGKALPLQTWTGLEGTRRLKPPDFKTIATWRQWVCQPYAPAAFTPRKYSWYSFPLGASLVLQNLPDYGPIIDSKHMCFTRISFVHHDGCSCTRRCWYFGHSAGSQAKNSARFRTVIVFTSSGREQEKEELPRLAVLRLLSFVFCPSEDGARSIHRKAVDSLTWCDGLSAEYQ
jgi:hypothetical protein